MAAVELRTAQCRECCRSGAKAVSLLLVLPSERKEVPGELGKGQVREQGNLSYLCIQNVLLAAQGRRMHTVNYMAKYPVVFFNRERKKAGGDLRDKAVQLAGSFLFANGDISDEIQKPLQTFKISKQPSGLVAQRLPWP